MIMKKLILSILFIIFSLAGFSQANLQYVNSKDSFEIRNYSDKVPFFKFNRTKGLIFPDETIQGTAYVPADNAFSIFNFTDNTKIIDFDASPITTGNTRTITMADADVDLGLLTIDTIYTDWIESKNLTNLHINGAENVRIGTRWTDGYIDITPENLAIRSNTNYNITLVGNGIFLDGDQSTSSNKFQVDEEYIYKVTSAFARLDTVAYLSDIRDAISGGSTLDTIKARIIENNPLIDDALTLSAPEIELTGLDFIKLTSTGSDIDIWAQYGDVSLIGGVDQGIELRPNGGGTPWFYLDSNYIYKMESLTPTDTIAYLSDIQGAVVSITGNQIIDSIDAVLGDSTLWRLEENADSVAASEYKVVRVHSLDNPAYFEYDTLVDLSITGDSSSVSYSLDILSPLNNDSITIDTNTYIDGSLKVNSLSIGGGDVLTTSDSISYSDIIYNDTLLFNTVNWVQFGSDSTAVYDKSWNWMYNLGKP